MEDKINSIFKKYPKLNIISIWIILFLIFIILAVIVFNQQEDSSNLNINNNSQNNINKDTIIDFQDILVEISGQISKPGVYLISENTIVLQLIEKAGGLTEYADLEYLHEKIQLARKLVDGEKIYIPTYIFNNSNVSNTSENNNSIVNINTASQKEIESLNGVGEVTAEKIIENRPYSYLEELKIKAGLSDVVYNKIVSDISL